MIEYEHDDKEPEKEMTEEENKAHIQEIIDSLDYEVIDNYIEVPEPEHEYNADKFESKNDIKTKSADFINDINYNKNEIVDNSKDINDIKNPMMKQ